MFLRMMALVAAMALSASAQTPPVPVDGAKVEKSTKALIQGKIVHATTQEPLKRATMMLFLQNGSTTPIRAESDDAGAFEFRDLAPGKYSLFADKQGFARQAYGSRGNPLVGSTLTLAAGQELKGLLFACTPNTVITGKVMDETGEGLANVQVMALRNLVRRGKKDYLPNGAAMTNDLGEYRIPSLGPGKYLIVAVVRQLGLGLAGTSQKSVDGKPVQGVVTTFYPNSTDVAAAAPVDAMTGMEIRGIDIRLVKTSVVSVKGKVSGIPVPLSKQMLAWIMPKGAGVLGLATRQFAMIQAADGAFEFKNVAPGSYVLTVTGTDGSADSSGAVGVDVGEQSLEGVQLVIGQSPELQGSITVASETPVSFKGTQAMLEPIDFVAIVPPRAAVDEGGKFTFKSMAPDRYLVQIVGGPQELYVKSVRYGNQDILETGLDATSGVAGTVEVKMGTDGAVVDGVVMGADDKPMMGATVALIPESKLRSRYKNMTTDQRGSFSFKGVAPGAYKLLAWEVIDPGAHEDVEFVKQFESKAEKVSAKENGALSFQLKAIPAPEEMRRK